MNTIKTSSQSNSIRVVSLVPSITETLLKCGVNIVGRSRFCIHPVPEISTIPKVGGTKDVNWEKVAEVKPDIIILDKEENTLEMANACPFEYVALHIQSVEDVARELGKLSTLLNNAELESISARWQKVLARPAKTSSLEKMPGIIEWWNPVTSQKNFIYLIWRNPWMAAGDNIFIQSMLDRLGYKTQRIIFETKYPEIDLTRYSKDETLLLCSSEPYPFSNHQAAIQKLGYSCALIDGELFSWYGIRSLLFLEAHL